MKTLSSIYYGEIKHNWGIDIEDWSISKEELARISEYQKSLEARLD